MSDERALALDLFDAGLLQFGRFVTAEEVQPFQHHLAMLGSYPALLHQIALGLAAKISAVDRLLCGPGSVPLGTALALETGIPLVIGRGGGADGARDFVGAYDIGHPAALIAHACGEASSTLAHHAGRFGLNVRCVAAVLDTGPSPLAVSTVALLRLPVVVEWLIEEGRIPGPLGFSVLDWLDEEA